MAFRQILSKRTSLVARQRFPSFSYAIHDDERKNHSPDEGLLQPKVNSFVQQRFFGSGLNGSAGFGAFFQNRRSSHFSSPLGIGSSLCSRYMSSTGSEGSGNVDFVNDVAGVLTETVQEVASQVPAVNEVAVAAADSFYNVAALQHIIDAVHSFTGFNWWASIAVTTLLIRTATIPLLLQQLKASSKLMAIRPQMEELGNDIKAKGGMGSLDSQRKLKALYKKHGVSPFTPLRGIFIQAPIFASFFFAISNMAEKVPSFKNGGALWFTDLSTPDGLYILPVVTALTFLIMVESNTQEGMEGNPKAGTMKLVSRVFAVLTVPLTMGFPKAIFCYWLTSNIFSFIYGNAIKPPAVRKFLGLPEAIAPATTATPKPVFAALKQLSQHRSQLAAEPAKSTKQSVSSSPVNNTEGYKKIERELRRRNRKSKR